MFWLLVCRWWACGSERLSDLVYITQVITEYSYYHHHHDHCELLLLPPVLVLLLPLLLVALLATMSGTTTMMPLCTSQVTSPTSMITARIASIMSTCALSSPSSNDQVLSYCSHALCGISDYVLSNLSYFIFHTMQWVFWFMRWSLPQSWWFAPHCRVNIGTHNLQRKGKEVETGD